VDVIDPADEQTWPRDIRVALERLAVRCETRETSTSDGASRDVRLEHADASFEAEEELRVSLRGRFLTLFHATRLLSCERDAIREEGLVPLDEDQRSRRLDRVIDTYGEEIGVGPLERLRGAGPLYWDRGHLEGRLGKLFGVTPPQVAFDHAGDGMTVFVENWGGESFYWAESKDLRDTLGHLTDRSAPAIVVVAIEARWLSTHTLAYLRRAGRRTARVPRVLDGSVRPAGSFAGGHPGHSSHEWPLPMGDPQG